MCRVAGMMRWSVRGHGRSAVLGLHFLREQSEEEPSADGRSGRESIVFNRRHEVVGALHVLLTRRAHDYGRKHTPEFVNVCRSVHRVS